MSTLKLGAILPADAVIETGNPDLAVSGVTADSRAVKPGDIFVAIAGNKADGLKFVAPAIAAGAAAIVAQQAPETPLSAGVAFVRSGNVRRALSLIAALLVVAIVVVARY